MPNRTPVELTSFQTAAPILEEWMNFLDDMPRDLTRPSDFTLSVLADWGEWAATDNLTEDESSAIGAVYHAAVNWRARMGRPPVRFGKQVDAAAIGTLWKLRDDVWSVVAWSGFSEFGKFVLSAGPPRGDDEETMRKLSAALESCIEVKRSRRQGKVRIQLLPRSRPLLSPELREYLGPDWLACIDRLADAETFEQTVCCIRVGKAAAGLGKALGGDLEGLRAELAQELAAVESDLHSSSARERTQRVVLGGMEEGPIVLGKTKRKLTRPQYNVVKALLDAGDDGLTKDELVNKSRHGDARGILKRLADSDSDWKEVIRFAGRTGGRYRIK
jgi:hypothetical protein